MGGSRLVWTGGVTTAVAVAIAAILGATGNTGDSGSCRAYPAFPNAGCTGIPNGTVLTPHAGDLEITVDDTVVDAVDVERCILVSASGVTIKNSRAKCVFMEFGTRADDLGRPRMTVQDSELDCDNFNDHAPSAPRTAINYRNYNAYRNEIINCENAFDVESDATIEDNFVHDLWTSSDVDGPHTDGLQSSNGSRLIVSHNTIYAQRTDCHPPEGSDGSCNGTSAININNAAAGPSSTDTVVSENLIAGGTFTMYCPIVATSSFEVTDNHFSTAYGPKVGEFGPAADCNTNETKSGNVIHETGQAVNFG